MVMEVQADDVSVESVLHCRGLGRGRLDQEWILMFTAAVTPPRKGKK